MAENENEQDGSDEATEQAATDAAEQPAVESAAEAATGEKAAGSKRRGAANKKVLARAPRTPEERHQERLKERSAKAATRRRRRGQEREKAKAAGTAPAQELPPVHAAKRGAPKERQGIVVSSKADKTITVRIDFARQHRRYEKIVRSSSTLHAHDEGNEANEGDVVRVVESRPLSRTKRWRLVDVVERAR